MFLVSRRTFHTHLSQKSKWTTLFSVRWFLEVKTIRILERPYADVYRHTGSLCGKMCNFSLPSLLNSSSFLLSYTTAFFPLHLVFFYFYSLFLSPLSSLSSTFPTLTHSLFFQLLSHSILPLRNFFPSLLLFLFFFIFSFSFILFILALSLFLIGTSPWLASLCR